MGDNSAIEWTDATWNPTYGCSRASEGCRNCYAERFVHRFPKRFPGLTVLRGGRPGWTGKIQLAPERLDQPIRWRRPRRVFVNSLSDVFHEDIPFEYIAKIYKAMAEASQHQFQVLTKRPEVAVKFFAWLRSTEGKKHADEINALRSDGAWPLPNVWLGVSCEDQKSYDERVPLLQKCESAVRWISMEPLIGPIDMKPWNTLPGGLDWIVVGGESGPGARSMDAKWVEDIHGQCLEAGIPFHFKQWGKHSNNPDPSDPTAKKNGGHVKGGRTFKGKTWDEEPAKEAA